MNYEDGEAPDSGSHRIVPLAHEHGAAVVALTIDEEGQARTAECKVAIAERLLDDADRRLRDAPVDDILVDCLTFPIATGQEETRRDGLETIEAIRELKRRRPDVQTILGLSNISFGLNPAARHVLNSVFLHECVRGRAGLGDRAREPDRAGREIPDEQREAALDLVYDRRRDGLRPAAAAARALRRRRRRRR